MSERGRGLNEGEREREKERPPVIYAKSMYKTYIITIEYENNEYRSARK